MYMSRRKEVVHLQWLYKDAARAQEWRERERYSVEKSAGSMCSRGVRLRAVVVADAV
jgi:hypothetical protein